MTRFNVIALGVFLCLVLWLFFFGRDTIDAIQRGALAVSSPFIEGSDAVEETVAEFAEPEIDVVDLRQRYDALEEEVQLLRLEKREIDRLNEENRELRRALDYVERSPLVLIPAKVIDRDSATWYSTIVLDKGEDDGVRPESPVVIPVGGEAGLVGKILRVSGSSAVVLLLSDERCQVAARIIGSTEEGIVSGPRGSVGKTPRLRLRYLKKDARVDPGGTVISSGVGGVFPPNLVLGNVVEVSEGLIDQEAAVLPAVDFGLLENVFVVGGLREP